MSANLDGQPSPAGRAAGGGSAEPRRFLGVVCIRLAQALSLGRWTRVTAGVEQIARDFDAVASTEWSGQCATLCFVNETPSALTAAVSAGRAIWVRTVLELNLPISIAVHGAYVPRSGWTAKVAACRRLAADAPENAVLVTGDVLPFLDLATDGAAASLGRHLGTGLDVVALNSPVLAVTGDRFAVDPDRTLREAFRSYALGPEVRLLRYVGFRLAKKEPPSLDVRDVFVPPRLWAPPLHRPPPLPVDHELPRSFLAAHGAPAALIECVPWGSLLPRELSPPRTLPELFAERRSLIILGDPGAGKTTILRWLAVVTARGSLSTQYVLDVAEPLLPLPVSVGRLAELWRSAGKPTSPISLIARYFHDRGLGSVGALDRFLESRFSDGEVLLLLDGLDEVQTADREPIRSLVAALAASFPKNRYVITSRIVGYLPLPLPGGVEATVQPFDESEIEQWLRAFTAAYLKWETGESDPVTAGQRADDVHAAIRTHARLRGLAQNPFMLSGLALIHRAEGHLPDNRVHAYEIFARALCESWGRARRLVAGSGPRDIAYEAEGIPILGELAIRMHESHPSGVAPEAFVLDTLAHSLGEKQGVGKDEAHRVAREFLERAGRDVQILVERGAGQWGFLHLTFQEFFAAAGLHAKERFEQTARKHLFEPRWAEVIRLGVGYMALVQKRPEATRRFVEKLMDSPPGGKASWNTEVLKKQLPIALTLLADTGDVLPAALRERILDEFADWCIAMPPFVPDEAMTEIASSEIARSLQQSLGRRFDTDERPWPRLKLLWCLLANDPVDALARLQRLDSTSKGRWRQLTEKLARLIEQQPPALIRELIRKRGTADQMIEEILFSVKGAAIPGLGQVFQAVREAHAGSKEAHEQVRRTLLQQDPVERAFAVLGLGILHDAADARRIAGALKDEDGLVRGAAAVACSLLPLRTAPPALLKQARLPGDDFWTVAEREVGLWALWRIAG